MTDIFISYARADRDKIEKLAAALEAEGYSVWWDRHIDAGAEFSADIERELNAARAVIVCWSSEGVKSRWVKDEANIAAEAQKLVAITLDDELPPIGFRQYHAAPFEGWTGKSDGAAFQDLCRALAAKISGVQDDASSSTTSAVAAQSARQIGNGIYRAVWITAIVAPMIVAIVWIGVSVLGDEGANDEPQFAEAVVETDAPENAGAASQPKAASIAVLPFDDFSPAGDQEYFANGISEELLNVLARIDGLVVASRTSAFSFKGKETSIREIGSALGVAHVLEGSVRKAGDTLRITAQLIDTSNDKHLWSQTFDRALTAENIFNIQDEISAAIAEELKVQMSLGEDAAQRTTSLEAYELFLQGKEKANRRAAGDLTAAAEDLKRVIKLDPNFAPAYGELALIYLIMDNYEALPDQAGEALAEPLVAKIMELAPDSAEALRAAAVLANDQQRYEEALRFADRAITANPNYALGYLAKGTALIFLGDQRGALEVNKQARALDPLNSIILQNITSFELDVGDYDAAADAARANIRWNPGNPAAHTLIGEILAEEGDLASAHAHFKDAQAVNAEFTGVQDDLVELYAKLAMFDEAIAAARNPQARYYALLYAGRTQEAGPADQFGSFLALAQYYTGRLDAAYAGFRVLFDQLNMPDREFSYRYPQFFSVGAYLFDYADDPAAQLLMAKVENAFAGKAPGDLIRADALESMITLHVLQDDLDSAAAHLNRFLELGHADLRLLDHPVFAGLRERDDFADYEQRMKENAARHRAAIEVQLANPKPNWIAN